MEEVHLWRGTDEQRAQRFHKQPLRHFAYFNQQLEFPDWSTKVVLDFGGNDGNLLLEDGCTIRPENYYCLDVVKEALELGRQRFPAAHWVHYDRYNISFNPDGIDALRIPDLGVAFDIILAYSVFTHTTRDEMLDLVAQLQSRLAVGGVLAFTAIDPHLIACSENYAGNNLRWRLERSREFNADVDIERILRESRGARWCSLVDGATLYVESDEPRHDMHDSCVTYNVFYTVEELQRQFPNAAIRPPVNGSMHHCCILRNLG